MFIKLPNDDEIGTVNKTLLGIEYLLFIKLQVSMSESTGLITGVCVDKSCTFTELICAGYFPKVCPSKFPNC